jgi:hypothetical protein
LTTRPNESTGSKFFFFLKKKKEIVSKMKTLVFTLERVEARHRFICFVLLLASMVKAIECLPLLETATASPASTSTSPYVEDLLRLYNISNEDVEASRQKQIAFRHSASVNHRHFPFNSRQQQHHHLQQPSPHVQPEAKLPASNLDAQIIIHQRNR